MQLIIEATFTYKMLELDIFHLSSEYLSITFIGLRAKSIANAGNRLRICYLEPLVSSSYILAFKVKSEPHVILILFII